MTGRRVYLILIFGISAIVAIITLLVIGYRVFEFVLDDLSGQSLLDRVRAPLGLLVATGLAAGYHFSVWRRDRSALVSFSVHDCTDVRSRLHNWFGDRLTRSVLHS